MTMYYLGIFLLTHLAAGFVAMIIDHFFYREEIHKAIDELNQELDQEMVTSLRINKKVYSIVQILGGWYTLFEVLKSIFDYYTEPDDDDE